MVMAALCLVLAMAFPVWAADVIKLGVIGPMNFMQGKGHWNGATMAAEEINAKGGVKVGSEKRMLKVESIDIRDGAPGVPVPEALMGIEKIILEKKPTALLIGPFLGLLGTVWGVMETFSGIAIKQAASLQAMAPGVAGVYASSAFKEIAVEYDAAATNPERLAHLLAGAGRPVSASRRNQSLKASFWRAWRSCCWPPGVKSGRRR